jgi:hypothetical protein
LLVRLDGPGVPGTPQAEVRGLLGRGDVVPGMVAAIQRGTRSRVAANSSTGTRTSTCY